ncbi:MAG: photosynthetic complex assembly protein PuhC [Pseudomonadota bacterium]
MDNTFDHRAQGTGTQPQKLSPAPLLGAAVLMTALLIAVLTARLTGFDASMVPEAPVVDTRMLDFRDLPGGVVEVFDWDTQVLLERIPSGEGSFLRGVVRSLVRQRRGLKIANDPFELNLHADRRLVLRDPQTGEDVDLNAFGPTNLAVFSRLLSHSGVPAQEPSPTSR